MDGGGAGPEERTLFALGEVRREREIDYEIETCLNQNAPQAMLRDLHRPVTDWRVSPSSFERFELQTDAGRGAVREIKETIFADRRVPILDLVPTNAMWKAGWAESRQLIFKSSWADTPKFSTAYLPAWRGNW
jgi:hypothetical protein